MKKLSVLFVALVVIMSSCSKNDQDTPLDFASFVVVHASPTAVTAPTDTLNVFVGNELYATTGVTYLNTSTYLPVLAGSRDINLRRTKDVTSSLYVPSFTNTFERGGIYSFYVYDTTTTLTGTAKVLKLRDTLTLPANTNSKVRFLHLAPNAPAVDVVLVRTSIVPNDSVTIAGKTYVGATPNETTLAAFTTIPKGVYSVKLKLAGTQTLAIANTTVDMSRGTSIVEGGIFTLFATGTAKARPLVLRSFRNY